MANGSVSKSPIESSPDCNDASLCRAPWMPQIHTTDKTNSFPFGWYRYNTADSTGVFYFAFSSVGLSRVPIGPDTGARVPLQEHAGIPILRACRPLEQCANCTLASAAAASVTDGRRHYEPESPANGFSVKARISRGTKCRPTRFCTSVTS